MEAGEKYTQHRNQYPLIILNFKEFRHENYEITFATVRNVIASEFERHSYILETGLLNQKEIRRYQDIIEEVDNQELFRSSIQFLSVCLERVYKRKVIILIDEYDVPLENAFFHGFYTEMKGFVRSFLSRALKTNPSLEFAVMTGCLRVSKESIFTGLNNLEIVSIQNKNYGEYYGFTQREVEDILSYYDKSHHIERIREWCNGYLFGEENVYNPWSVINYVKSILVYDEEFPLPYWSNTSSNSIIKELIRRADLQLQEDLEKLIQGGSIECQVREEITYEDIYASNENLWNFLFYTGYLKKTASRIEGESVYVTLEIPKSEVRYVYRQQIKEWAIQKIEQKDLTPLYEATLAGEGI